MKIELEGKVLDCNVQYGKRKKLSIHIDAIGLITVKVPRNTSEELIKSAITQKSEWLLSKLDAISKTKERPNKRVYHQQAKFMYLGKEWDLHELIGTEDLDEEALRKSLRKFYVSSCKKIIEERIKKFEKQLGVKPKTIEIVASNTKWGSCSSDKKITFNYRLVMAPLGVIDYVIIHELCHLIHMNHDRSFWRRVGSVAPDYKEKQTYLAQYGQYMTL